MAVTTTARLDRRFVKQAKGLLEKYNFDVGIIQDGVHRSARGKKAGLKSYAGGPARKASAAPDGTLSEISEKLRKQTRINFYTRPFKSKKNKDILAFTKSFFNLVRGSSQKRRCENLLQAIVRNPILRGDYGSNSALTQKIKGFNRFMIDTGQIFKAIKAKVRIRRV